MFDATMFEDDEGSLPADNERRVWRYELIGATDGTVHAYPPNRQPVPWSQFRTAGERWGWRALGGHYGQ